MTIPAWRRFYRVLLAAANHLLWNEGFELAGYVAYTALLAVFPFLIFLAALAGTLGDVETANQFVDITFRFLPQDVADALAPPIREVLSARRVGLATFGGLATLWVASS